MQVISDVVCEHRYDLVCYRAACPFHVGEAHLFGQLRAIGERANPV
jgi:hypothetical protein